MINPEYIGFIGAAILVVAWAFETIEVAKKHKVMIDLKFAVASLSATWILVVYSWMIANPIFFWLNLILAKIVLLEVLYTIGIRKVKFK